MTKTIVIQIGNSDNKLTQQEWAEFVQEMNEVIKNWVSQVHFFGGAAGWEPWQNVCWVAEIQERNTLPLFDYLAGKRKYYKQDSVAVLIGETEFI